MSIKIAGELVNPTVFPDKTTQVWKLSPEQLETMEVEWAYEGDHELMSILQIGELIGKHNGYKLLTLNCPQLPYARQDKEVRNDATFGLVTFISCIRQYYHTIKTFDVHNPHIINQSKLIRLENTLPYIEIGTIIEIESIDLIVFPDEGAKNRYAGLSVISNVYADKVRDQLSGEIKGITMHPIEKGKSILVVDDICDGGRTFVELAKLINTYDPSKLILYVSHGIFSKGIEVLYSAGFVRVYTKDGLQD